MSELHDQAPLYAVDALSPEQAGEFEAHLATCTECAAEVARLRHVTSELSTTVAADPPAELRARVLAEIATTPQDEATASDRRQGPASTSPGLRPAVLAEIATTPQDEPTAAEPQLGPGSTVSRLRSRLPYLVAAAAVIVALALGGWVWHSQSEASTAQRAEQQVTSLLAAPDVHLASGTVTNGGHVTLLVSRSQTKALLVARDLPHLSDGRVYELWTITGRPAPAGTFTPSGSVSVVDLPTAATTATQIAITVEPGGGSPAPTTSPIITIPVPSI
ncbi:MAG: anti-sigma factor domain-containing protein [Nocardioidaceae bacterium]